MCIVIAAPRLAYAQAAPLGGQGGSGRYLFTPQDDCTRAVGCAAPGSITTGNVTYHGGPVMHNVTNYAIFWLPEGYHFDTPSIDPLYSGASDASYEALVGEFFRDLSNTSYYSVIQQYTDSAGTPGLATTFGGAWVDTTPYPDSEGTHANPLQDSDIQAEVSKAMAANGWSPNGGNSEFFVFTGYDVYSCAGTTCSYDDYCSYHSYFQAADGEDVVYANVPDPGNSDEGTCLATAGSGGPAPNGGAFADSAVNLVAHEAFESVTDPTFEGWYYQDIEHEVADECLWKFGAVSPDGANILLDGHGFLVQEVWSDRAGGCYIPQEVSSLSVTASYQLVGGGQPATPVLTYFSAGVLRSAELSSSPETIQIDVGTVWNVTGTLRGSTSMERWETGEPIGGVVTAAGAYSFTYYHQYLFSVSYASTGGSTPALSYSSLGKAQQTQLSQGPLAVWVDAGTEYSASNPLQGSTSGERWVAAGSNGTASSPEALRLVYSQQYLVGFLVTDASGSMTLVPSELEVGTSQPNATISVRDGEAWIDSGSTVVIKQMLWQGVDVEPVGYSMNVDSAQNVTVAARVYGASVRVSDYLGVPVSGARATLALANGTTVSRTTGIGGTVSLVALPLGTFNGTVSYLGFSERLSSGAPGMQVAVKVPVSIPDVLAPGAVLVLVALVAARRRRAR